VPTCPLISAGTNIKGTLSLCRSVASREQVRSRGSGVQSEANEGGQMHDGISQKKMERLSSEADMRRIVFLGNN